MNCLEKQIKYIKKRQFNLIRLSLLAFFICFFIPKVSAQDSIPIKEDLVEEVDLKFQSYFFKALSEKAIGNHQKAIENLENCNQLKENNTAVFFEFSKNYLSLNNINLAKVYLQRALKNDADNIWMLKHLVKIHQKENNLNKAIAVQKKVVQLNPKERVFLVRLYLYNRSYDEAILLMTLLEKESALPSSLKDVKTRLENRNSPKPKLVKLNDISSLVKRFEKEKTYTILEQILKISEKETITLLRYSDKGIALFPAQPFVYLMKAKALNNQQKFKDAISVLENGIDFVIDDLMEANFYEELARAYKGLGNKIEENNYNQKAKKIKS